jgi:hypothetical protein
MKSRLFRLAALHCREQHAYSLLLRLPDEKIHQFHLSRYDSGLVSSGPVSSSAERNAALHAAWSAPGMVRVVDSMEVAD